MIGKVFFFHLLLLSPLSMVLYHTSPDVMKALPNVTSRGSSQLISQACRGACCLNVRADWLSNPSMSLDFSKCLALSCSGNHYLYSSDLMPFLVGFVCEHAVAEVIYWYVVHGTQREVTTPPLNQGAGQVVTYWFMAKIFSSITFQYLHNPIRIPEFEFCVQGYSPTPHVQLAS